MYNKNMYTCVHNGTMLVLSLLWGCTAQVCDSNIMKPKFDFGEVIHTLTSYDKSSYQLIYY